MSAAPTPAAPMSRTSMVLHAAQTSTIAVLFTVVLMMLKGCIPVPPPAPVPPVPPKPINALQDLLSQPPGSIVDMRVITLDSTASGARVLAWAPPQDKPVNAIEGSFTFGPPQPMPPAPPVPPVPIPPVPVDPLSAAIQAALAADPSTTKAADAKSLAVVYRMTASTTSMTVVNTDTDLFNLVKGRSDSAIGPRLRGVRDVLKVELGKVMEPMSKTQLTAADKAAAVDLLTRFATALESMPSTTKLKSKEGVL
jgi:hypothetical protein